MNKATYIPIITLLLLFSGCKTQLLQDMVQFDKIFIPAQYFAYYEQGSTLQEALTVLEEKWNAKKEAYATYTNDAVWGLEISKIETYIKDAKSAAAKSDFFVAKDKLQNIQYTLSNLRQRYEINYIPDLLNNYGEHLKWIGLMTMNKSAEDLTRADMYEISNIMVELTNEWENLKEIPLNNKIYSFSTVAENTYTSNLVKTTESINELKWALETGDKMIVVSSTNNLMKQYKELLQLFGDFKQFDASLALK